MNLPRRSQLLGYLLTGSLSALGACANGSEVGSDDVSGRSREKANSQEAFVLPAPPTTSTTLGTAPASGTAPPTNGSAAVGASTTNAAASSAASHWLVMISFEKGQFKPERVRRVDGPLRQLHDDTIDDDLTYVANGPNGRLVAGAPDPRTRRLEEVDPATRKMRSRQLAPTGPQYLLLHVPEATDRLELFETRALPDRSSVKRALSLSTAADTTLPNPGGAAAPIASLSLKGLL